MREQLLVNNKPNGRFIIPIATASVILYLLETGGILWNNFDFFHENASRFLSGMIFPLVSSFAYPYLWAWALSLTPAGDKTKDIVIPGTLLALFAVLLSVAMRMAGAGYYSDDGSISSTESIIYYGKAASVAFIMVGFCEGFYDKFNNKVMLYCTGSGIAALVSIGIAYLQYMSVALMIPGILTNALYFVSEYFMAMFIFRASNIPVPIVLTHDEQVDQQLSAVLQTHVDNDETVATTLTAAQAQFPGTPFNTIANAYTGIAPASHKSGHNGGNVVLIGASLLSFLYAIFMIGTSSWGSYSSVEDLLPIAVNLFLPAVAAIRLKIATDMLDYKPYTYKTLVLLGVLASLISLGEIFLSKWRIPMPFLTFIANLVFVILAWKMSSNLYPRYALLFKNRYTSIEDFREDEV